MKSLLLVEQLVAGYGGTTVLDGVHLDVRSGERVGIVGRNGAGKTTTLASIMGLTEHRGGRIAFEGVDITNQPAWFRSRAGLGHVPQTRDIFASLSVEENLVAGLKGASKQRLSQAYELFPRLVDRRRNFGNELSGGEQQMLSIARALMGNPSVLLLDEPLEGLSPIVAAEVMAAIHQMVLHQGLACVLVEQQVSLVLDFCTRILVLERGRAVFWGSSDALRADPRILESSVALGKNAMTADGIV